MNKWITILENRRRTIQSLPWLRYVLWGVDVIFFFVGQVMSGLLFGGVLFLISFLLNETLTPTVVQKIFYKELGGYLPMTGDLGKRKIINNNVSVNDNSVNK
jgi:hypothetical protein